MGTGVDCLHQLLEATAELHPDRIAVEDPERRAALGYRELDAAANRIREVLLEWGVGTGDRVAILAGKSVGAVAAIFGVLKAGAAYVPLDPASPPERNARIAADCEVRALIGWRRLLEGLRTAGGNGHRAPRRSPPALAELGLDCLLPRPATRRMAPERDAAVAGDAPGDRPAYLLYTSGSTGRPKGIVHTHRSALAFLDWCSRSLAPRQEDRFAAHAPFHFDLSILDVFLPLRHGATLVLIEDGLAREPRRLAPFIARQCITVWYSTPSILRLLTDYGRLERHHPFSLRLVLFAGEVFPVKQLRALRRIWARPRFFNLYGPTETNVCTYYELPPTIPPQRSEPFPIGFACSNCRTRVVDERGEGVARGRRGELLVSGASLMRGYWNLPEENLSAFVRDRRGRAWYRTGDLVRETAEGYVFLGRRDRMVKRLGHRVELGEIEAALLRHPQIAEVAVVAQPDDETGVQISAFIGWPGSDRPSVIQMKRFCAERLPSYMSPGRFSFTAALPRTSTGKIDYRALAEAG